MNCIVQYSSLILSILRFFSSFVAAVGCWFVGSCRRIMASNTRFTMLEPPGDLISLLNGCKQHLRGDQSTFFSVCFFSVSILLAQYWYPDACRSPTDPFLFGYRVQ